MIAIAICDDEKFTCNYIKDIVLNYCEENSIDITINEFYSGEDLCGFINKGNNIDILFLDIELGKLDGVQVGRYIRTTIDGENSKIIYVSSRESYAMQLFKVRPFDFLIKPIIKKEVENILSQVIKIMYNENIYFEYNVGKTYHKIKYNEILYFYSQGKKIKIVTTDTSKNIEFYGKLEEVSNELNDKFLSIHKSYLVNFDSVAEYGYDTMKLINRDELPISKANRKDIRLKIMKRSRS